MINHETITADFESKPHPMKLYTIQLSTANMSEIVKLVSDFELFTIKSVFFNT